MYTSSVQAYTQVGACITNTLYKATTIATQQLASHACIPCTSITKSNLKTVGKIFLWEVPP